MFLEMMQTTSGAHLDSEGAMIPSGEFVAALYESYAADCEPADTSRTEGAYERNVSLNGYANSAARLADGLWVRDLQSVMPEYADNHMEW